MPSYFKKIQRQQIIAAIDLGSNALRATIARKTKGQVEILKNFREPLRLGEDVFSTGVISEEKFLRTEEAFIRLLHLFVEYNVTEVSACATSAMRDSKNGKILANSILDTTGIKIKTIDGHEEARLIFEAVKDQVNIGNRPALIMDIGGGSTELIILKNKKIIGIKSFKVGTVRLLQYKNEAELEIKIETQIEDMITFIKSHLGKRRPEVLIGTGGNLRRIGKIRKTILGKETSQMALFSEINHMEEAIISMSYVERIRRLELEENRADVILPAIMLTHHLMKILKMNRINLPKVGLKEGIILSMLPVRPKKFILKD